MNAKEEKILGLFKEKNKMLAMDEIPDLIDENLCNTFNILEDLREKGKIKQIWYDQCLFFASEKTMSAFEKKIREVEAEFGIP